LAASVQLFSNTDMLGFFLNPAVLWLILFFVARHDAARSYSTLFFVSLGISVVALVSSIYIPQFTIIVTSIVCILALKRFCYMGWLRAIIATILFIVWLCVWPILFGKFTH
jgi:hypothetical protein